MKYLLDDEVIEVEVIYKKNKNIRISYSDAKVYLYLNRPLSDSQIKRLLDDNINVIKRLVKRANNRVKFEFKDGSKIKFFDQEFNVKLGVSEGVYGSTFLLNYLDPLESFKNLSKKYALPYFEYYLKEMIKEHNLPLKNIKVVIKNNKSTFGICNPKKNQITFTSLLPLYPLPLIKYVIAHELTHFKHLDHSKKFHEELEKIYPNHLEYQRKLRRY